LVLAWRDSISLCLKTTTSEESRKISETFNVQFRAEFFNVFNRANFQAPIANSVIFNEDGWAVGGAGAIGSTTTDPRQLQFA
jgi:hypothetical protein